MKKLLFKLMVFIALFVFIDYGIGMVFTHFCDKAINLPIDYGTAYLKVVKQIDDDIVIFGESRARHQYVPSLIEDALGLSTINVAMDGSYMSQQAAVIRLMLNRHIPKVIIWEVDAVSIMDKFRNDEIDRMSDLNPFYDIDSLSHNLVLQKGDYEWIKMWSRAYRNNNCLLRMIRVLSKGDYNDTLKGYWPVKTKGYKYPTKRDRIFEDDLNNEKLQLLKMTIADIQKSDCILIIVNSPQYENCNLETTFQGLAFDSLLDEMNVAHLNHHFDSRLLEDSTLFKDCSHLNAKGVEIYMGFLIPEIKQFLENEN